MTYNQNSQQPPASKQEARQLAKEWDNGTANVKTKNFLTEGDRNNPRTFEQDLADIGEKPETQGGEKVHAKPGKPQA